MDPLLWSIALLMIAIAVIVLELFIPSSGILSCIAAGAVIASIAVAFSGGLQLGTIMLVVNAFVVPSVLAAAVKFWPDTPIGRLILIQRPVDDEDREPGGKTGRDLKKLIGHRGTAKSKMLPSGAVRIDGRTWDAVSEGVAIEPGQPIEVVAVRTNRIVVRPVDRAARPDEPPAGNILAQPIETVVPDPFDEPTREELTN